MLQQTKNAIVHVADACIFAKPNMSPTLEKPLFPTMSDKNQIVPATGAGKLDSGQARLGFVVFCLFFVRIVKHEVIYMYCEASRPQLR